MPTTRRPHAQRDQVHLLGGFQIATAHQVAQHVNVKRLALRQDVEDQRQSRRQSAQLPSHYVAEVLRYRDVLVPHPHPGHLPYPAGCDLVFQHLPQEQRVSAGETPEPLGTAGIHRSAEAGLDHIAGALDSGSKVEPREQAVLPQRSHGIRFGTSRAHGHHQTHTAGLRKLVHDMCGQPIE